jgi:hypothetical protein
MKTTLFSIILILSFWAVPAQNFNYLGTYSSNGTPDYLESPGDNVSTETLELINNALPETFQVPSYNPHYITSGYDSDIFVTQQTDVFMTFVDEGAGFRNVIGFYTYDLDNPPTTAPEAEDITIIFPNNSKLGSGGGLQAGDKVKLGTFDAGTGIGFVVLANGWNGSRVTNGYWRLFSNPNFNPESDISKRHHNVLIKDDDHELVILGFEDINREHSWCDHDFNDALYYITATNYSDITTTNVISSDTSTDVYTANLGGFESKGDLTGKMALKNISRLKASEKQASTKARQSALKSYAQRGMGLDNYFPEKGMFEVEEALVSTSSDPTAYSNATDVFSVDYYLNNERVSAGLVTTTDARIYDHSKHICDRLNGSILKDVRPVVINNHRVIFSIIKRANGAIEYTVSFSIKKGASENTLYSLWNIGDYPAGDYINFQLWGNSMGQVAHLVRHITGKLADEKTLVSNADVDKYIPTVFVSSATYRNKKLKIDFINKSKTNQVTINANIRKSEQAAYNNSEQTIPLTGAFYQSVELDTGFMFDGGFAIINKDNNSADNVYLADGTWGSDYDAAKVTLNKFEILEQTEDLSTDVYEMERSVAVAAETKGVFNVFRYPKPGDLSMNTKQFESVQFNLKSNVEIEVSLVIPNLDKWENRWKYTVPATSDETLISIDFSKFENPGGKNNGTIDEIKMVMFSVKGTDANPVNFAYDVKNLAFKSSGTLSTDEVVLEATSVVNYPNPFSHTTFIQLPQAANKASLSVYDMLGRQVFGAVLPTVNNGKTIEYNSPKVTPGVYFYQLTDDKKRKYKGKFIIEE